MLPSLQKSSNESSKAAKKEERRIKGELRKTREKKRQKNRYRMEYQKLHFSWPANAFTVVFSRGVLMGYFNILLSI